MGNLVWGSNDENKLFKNYLLYKNYNILLKMEIGKEAKEKFIKDYKFWDSKFEQLMETCNLEFDGIDKNYIPTFFKVTIYDENEEEKEYMIESLQDLMWLKVNWHLYENIEDNIFLSWEGIELACKQIILQKFEFNDNDNKDWKRDCLDYERKYKTLATITHLNKTESRILN